MNLTSGQEQALKMTATLNVYEGEPKVCVLAGLAGTGKTTVLQQIKDQLGGMPRIVAPTGKAALRVMEATGLPATTIHKWCYKADFDEKTGQFYFVSKPVDELREDCGEIPLLVVDEASMIGSEMWDDLHNICSMLEMNVLLVGDPFQLPPVENAQADFDLLAPKFQSTQRVLMTEIVRQALDSPIIRASMAVRAGRVDEAVYELPRVKNKELMDVARRIVLSGSGVAIVHRNETRKRMNELMHISRGYDRNQLVEGEPLLVLKNNYLVQRYNGEITALDRWVDPPRGNHTVYDPWSKGQMITQFGVAQLPSVEGDIWAQCLLAVEEVLGRAPEGFNESVLEKKARMIYGGGGIDDKDDIGSMSNEEVRKKLGPPLLHANLGYSLTAHKSQGSEWDDVLVCLESSVKTKFEDGRRWLYTALTRAKKSVRVCIGASLTPPGDAGTKAS